MARVRSDAHSYLKSSSKDYHPFTHDRPLLHLDLRSLSVMSEQQAYEVREFAGDKWASASSVVSRPIPVPKKGEVLVQVYLRPGTPGMRGVRAIKRCPTSPSYSRLLQRLTLPAVNPTDVLLLQTGYGGAVPLPGIVGSEGGADSCAA